MTVDFSQYFWGEGQKNCGIDVLFQNMKYGITTTKELTDFLRERSSVEEAHSKSLGKLAKVASNGCPNGTFAPMWQVLKTSSDKLSNAHVQMVQKVEELVKELVKYADDLQKKYKTVKDEEAVTIEAIQLYQNSKIMVCKTKNVYCQRFLELEKCQKENAAVKDIEKAEIKMKKSHEEYKAWTEKYESYTEDYLIKMTSSCKHFQDVEVTYLRQMKEFLDNYAVVMENNHDVIGQIHTEFRQECSKVTIEGLLEQFVRNKATGNDKPSKLEVEEVGPVKVGLVVSRGSGSSEDKSTAEKPAVTMGEKKREGNIDNSVEDIRSTKGSRRTTSLLNLFIPLSQGNKGISSSKGTESPSLDECSGLGQPNATNNKPSLSRSANRGSKWFLRSRRGKKKEKKNKKKDGSSQDGKEDKSDAEDKDESHKSDTPTAEVDEEGYTVRPRPAWENDKSSFYSSSDSDSDEEPEKRLHVEIKPLTNGTAPLSASVDELRSTVENLTLSPVGLTGRKLLHDADNQMKRSQSVSQQIGSTSPPSRHPYTPLSPPVPPPNPRSSPKLNQTDSTSRYADLGDIFAEVGDFQPALPPKVSQQRNTPTPSGVAIPRPPSRPRPEVILQRNTSSPSPAVSRTESVSSLETRSIGSHLIGSRGPSPLTLGMSDSIPLAVAFHEIVHAYFKGNDENQCQVKMTGDMMVSFPAGIIQVFASNPTPAQLTFKVRSKQALDNLVSNKDLVKVDKIEDELHFEFNMSALIVLLKNHSEQNPNASYFNVDILKYHITPKPGAGSCPLHLVAFWKCESSQTDLRIDYKYNSHSMEANQSEVLAVNNKSLGDVSLGAQLLQVCIAAPVDGGVKTMQSKPTGQWFPNTNRACWKLPSLSGRSDNQGVGSLRARFEISSGPSSHGTIAAQFSCESSTLSGCDFELQGSGYRVSLIKKRFVSGKYICDAEDSVGRYAVPPDCSIPI